MSYSYAQSIWKSTEVEVLPLDINIP